MTSLVVAVLRRRNNILCHLGLFLILFGGFFGAPFFSEGTMKVSASSESCIAVSSEGKHFRTPFNVRLLEFKTEYYDDGKNPKQYSSRIIIDGVEKVTAVGKPCLHKGYLIYQSGHEGESCSIIKIVRDPFLAVVFLGMLLAAIGALMSISSLWQSWITIAITICLSVVFGVISLTRIHLGTMAPALRSLWFIPHLAAYMIAYALLALSIVLWIIRKKETALKLVGASSSLLLIGMLCGAVWAKFAWGDYWSWDPKECWAAATWLLTLMATHIPKDRRKLVFITILLAFLSMQITWYGVNYLPSASESIHTYR